MDERLRFIARLLEGDKMAPLCREFGISRVTGYRVYNRYKDSGLDGLNDRSRECLNGIALEVSPVTLRELTKLCRRAQMLSQLPDFFDHFSSPQ
jgi:transposase-like protein